MIKVGSQTMQCPAASLLDAKSGGKKKFQLKDYKGKYLVLFFYPKDDTPGCTQESIEFSQKLEAFHNLGAEVVGISKDSIESHEKFISKHKLTTPLISDEDNDISEYFGTFTEKNMFGKKYMGIERSTFIIGPEGEVLHEWRKVKVGSHVDEVLEVFKNIKNKH